MPLGKPSAPLPVTAAAKASCHHNKAHASTEKQVFDPFTCTLMGAVGLADSHTALKQGTTAEVNMLRHCLLCFWSSCGSTVASAGLSLQLLASNLGTQAAVQYRHIVQSERTYCQYYGSSKLFEHLLHHHHLSLLPQNDTSLATTHTG
jgi:hypothetical protein